jgi:5-formyltetrahydrofolate cyclo-ligase
MDIQTTKAALREEIRLKMEGISLKERAAASRELCKRLRKQTVWKSAGSILFFAPMADEPDIWPLLVEAIKLGKIVTLPRYLPRTKTYIACRVLNAETETEPGQFGIREPNARTAEVPLNQLDFVLVPGVAFDLNRRRLGRGRGFYDRLLAEVRGVTCGVAFDEQIVERTPAAPHDVVLNCILTPTRWVEPKQRAVL